MQTSVFAAVEVVTIFGLSLAASVLLATGLVGALKPPAESPGRAGASEASKIARLPPIAVIGSRLAATGEANNNPGYDVSPSSASAPSNF